MSDHECATRHEDEICIKGEIYGYCDSPACGGMCEATRQCSCHCHRPMFAPSDDWPSKPATRELL